MGIFGGKHEPDILKDGWSIPSPENCSTWISARGMDVRDAREVPVHTFGEPAGVKCREESSKL